MSSLVRYNSIKMFPHKKKQNQIICPLNGDLVTTFKNIAELMDTMRYLINTLQGCSREEKNKKLHSIQLLYAHGLFASKEYSLSLKEFLKLNTDPSVVIALFPELDSDKKKAKGKDFESALAALMQYLTEIRRMLEQRSNETGSVGRTAQRQLELVDSTLLKCYSHRGNYKELLELYKKKGQHENALNLLREHAKQKHSCFKGYHIMKEYLQHLGPEHTQLILNFADWFLEEHPAEGFKIFTEDIAEVKNLPRTEVFHFLRSKNEKLSVLYLEHIILKWRDTNSLFHNTLISYYRQKITSKKGTFSEQEICNTRSRLQYILSKSNYYTPERVIVHLPNDSLFEERAIVLGKLGNHEEALTIHLHILGDIRKAEQYCKNVTSTTNKGNEDVFLTLMRMLINPEQRKPLEFPPSVPVHPKTAVPDIESALNILEKHIDKIPPLKALEMLPDSVPLERLKCLESALDSQVTTKKRAQILRGLQSAEHTQVEDSMHFHVSKNIVIYDYSVCSVCQKPLKQYAFLRYPNGKLVHFKCKVDM